MNKERSTRTVSINGCGIDVFNTHLLWCMGGRRDDVDVSYLLRNSITQVIIVAPKDVQVGFNKHFEPDGALFHLTS